MTRSEGVIPPKHDYESVKEVPGNTLPPLYSTVSLFPAARKAKTTAETPCLTDQLTINMLVASTAGDGMPSNVETPSSNQVPSPPIMNESPRIMGKSSNHHHSKKRHSGGSEASIMSPSFGHGSFSSVGTETSRTTERPRSHSLTSTSTNNHLSSPRPHRHSPVYDPMRVVTPFQLQALELLDTTPMWVFDFIQRKNRWANASGLKLWNAPSLQEFLDRDMTDMSETAVIRTQKLQDRITQGQKVQEQWTFYPKGKAKTVAVTVTAMRMSEDENHCCMLVVGTFVKLPVPKRNKTAATISRTSEAASTTASCCSSRSCGTSQEEDDLTILYEADENDDDNNNNGDPPRPSSISSNLHDSLQSLPAKEEIISSHESTFSNHTLEESRVCEVEQEDEDDEHDAYLESNPLYQENFRVVEILRYLPTAVCMFDMEGRAMYQNPASYIPDDHILGSRIDVGETQEEEKTEENEDSFHDSDNLAEGRPLSFGNQNGFMRRFVDPKVANDVFEKLRDESTSFASLNIEAELHTNERGKTQWSAIQLRKTLDPVTGEPVILFSSFDRSDAIEAQKERKARIAESEFLAIMAHEIRTPLHQVTGFIDLLESSSAPSILNETNLQEKEQAPGPMNAYEAQSNSCNLNEEQSGYIKLLRSSATQLMTVINDVLDYSKLEAGQMKIENIPFEPMSVVKGSIAAMQGSCEEKGLTLTMEYGQNQYEIGTGNPFASKKAYSVIPFRIMGDPNRLRQVLLNLLSNAIKFTTTGGIHIQVSSYVSDQDANGDFRRWIRFVVTDTGAGISEENQAAVFQKYRQANDSDARKFGGTGLGLSICQSLVHKMGGTIGVDSELGVGSSFWFSLPITTPKVTHDSLKREIERTRDDGPILPMKILVAEDNKVNQKLVANMLKRMGHYATVVENGQEAIDIIKRLQEDSGSVDDSNRYHPTRHSYFDAVLMDIQMPVMDGLEATRRLRHMGYTDLPILGLTASQKRSDFDDLGFDDWLPKPIPMKELKTRLRYLKEKALEHEKVEGGRCSNCL